MASYNPKRLYVGQPATTSATLYTVPASTSAIVKNIIITNTTGTAATLTLSIVPSGGTAGATNRIITGLSVSGNDTAVFDISAVMATGDFIAGLQGTSGSLTVNISGVEIA